MKPILNSVPVIYLRLLLRFFFQKVPIQQLITLSFNKKFGKNKPEQILMYKQTILQQSLTKISPGRAICI